MSGTKTVTCYKQFNSPCSTLDLTLVKIEEGVRLLTNRPYYTHSFKTSIQRKDLTGLAKGDTTGCRLCNS